MGHRWGALALGTGVLLVAGVAGESFDAGKAPVARVRAAAPRRAEPAAVRARATAPRVAPAVLRVRPTALPGSGVAIWPKPIRAGRPAVVELTDPRARTAARLVVCVRRPGAPSRCLTAVRRFESGGRRVAVGLRVGQPGLWRVEVRDAGPYPVPAGAFDVKRTVRVVPGALRLLATGDSEIQLIDEMLAAGLPAVRVTSEARISTGISKPQMFDWVSRAAAQGPSIRPDITVVYIGANDGFPLATPAGRRVDCCQPAWVKAFARRTRSMMASYLRGGAGRVFWFTLPAPRDAPSAAIFRAVNQAYVIAAASFPAGVRLIDLRPVFTPGGRYRESMYYQGRYLTVREPDGYHLSVGGDRIATSIAIGAMRADGLLG